MEKALALKHLTPETLHAAAVAVRGAGHVVNRGGVLERDNGVCKNTYQLAFYGGVGPNDTSRRASRTRSRSRTSSAGRSPYAKARLEGQPLDADDRLQAGEDRASGVGFVVGQFPRQGTRVGRTTRSRSCCRSRCTASCRGSSACASQRRAGEARAAEARREGRRRAARGKVVAQSLPPEHARPRPACAIMLTVEARERPADEARAGEAVAPRLLDRLRDPDPRAGHDLDRRRARRAARTAARRAAARRARASRRAPGTAVPGPAQRRRRSSSPRRSRISLEPVRRLERPDQHGARDSLPAAHEVEAPVDAVGAVDVGVAAGEEHRRVARGAAVAEAVRRRDPRGRTPRPRRSSPPTPST